MKPGDVELLARILEYESSHDQKQEWPLGWNWEQVRVQPATLNRLVIDGCLEVVFHSNSYKGYRLSERGKLLAIQGEPQPEIEQDSGPVSWPEDVFGDIIGHDEVKELLRAAVTAERPVHVLLAGPPALAKSLFLWGLERVAGSRALWLMGSASSKAGLWDLAAERRPRLLLVDELDKMAAVDTAALLSLMEGGRLVRAKVGRRLEEQLDLRVVAATNNLRVLAPELLSRFAVRRLQPYQRQEFRQVVVGVLVRREGVAPEVAEQVAALLDGVSQDVRDAVRVARLAPQVGVEKAVALLGLGASSPSAAA
ncbi:MAG: ATP-binding protein [Chloroflexota bacterium]|nr:ATP-binding protein [Chloroflexota bacterium]